MGPTSPEGHGHDPALTGCRVKARVRPGSGQGEGQGQARVTNINSAIVGELKDIAISILKGEESE